jgi:hypothetical protein
VSAALDAPLTRPANWALIASGPQP